MIVWVILGTKLEQLEMISSSIGIHWSKILRVEGKLQHIEEKMETNYNNILVKIKYGQIGL